MKQKDLYGQPITCENNSSDTLIMLDMPDKKSRTSHNLISMLEKSWVRAALSMKDFDLFFASNCSHQEDEINIGLPIEKYAYDHYIELLKKNIVKKGIKYKRVIALGDFSEKVAWDISDEIAEKDSKIVFLQIPLNNVYDEDLDRIWTEEEGKND
ncbi:MAG TPA: hypothetical protein PLK90_08330 [Clostridiales bacterium]|nr:hypothetical protein [Clostridiales bacterium]HQP70388.1 hypothetical protein [Clostridiales bacterium]